MNKKAVLQMVVSYQEQVVQEADNVSNVFEKCIQDNKDYINTLLHCKEMSKGSTGMLLAKTPKLNRKKNTKIKAIPEDEEMDVDTTASSTFTNNTYSTSDVTSMDASEIPSTRSRRGASVRAANNIKKQQTTQLKAKLRRPSNDDENAIPLINKLTKEKQRSKQTKDVSLDDEVQLLKQIKIEKKMEQSKSTILVADLDNTQGLVNSKSNDSETKESKRSLMKRKYNESFNDDATITSNHNSPAGEEPAKKKPSYFKSPVSKVEKDSRFIKTLTRISEKGSLRQSPRLSNKENEQVDNERFTRSSTQSIINAAGPNKIKGVNVINETLDGDETIASMYEDAVAKMPIMNSTMNPASLGVHKAFNATVIIEPLKHQINNETITITKNFNKNTTETKSQNSTLKEIEEFVKPVNSKKQKVSAISMNPQLRLQQYEDLLTDDESSPEREPRKAKNDINQILTKRVTRSQNSSMSDVDEIQKTPTKNKPNRDITVSIKKSGYKQSVLFSPYSKESVRKRVEAFEQAVSSPTGEEAIVRLTRIKTRALAAAQNPAQKLARKSLAKAKVISLAKNNKEMDDTKENDSSNIPRLAKQKKSSLDKPPSKAQAKTTPLGKKRGLQVPGSGGKSQFATPSNSQNLNAYSKPITGPRGNIVTHVDSFLQSTTKSAQKTIDRAAEEKRRRANEEDARRKREELLKAQAEERRRKRKEKELKNKLAREAKERLEQEKRLKAEKEREEKAKLALLLQEKHKEEKRMMQLQRAQEKEERRKQEELLRLQRAQEQEEQERIMLEQKREQELEKRKIQAELKAKAQLEKAAMQAKAKALAQKQIPTSYKIDSDPDEEESDDESKPKHPIPSWATRNLRQPQLEMQQYIPMKLVLKFFDAKSCTPDLKDLFQGIDPKKLKRSSSAIWKTPPRYSMMNKSIIDD